MALGARQRWISAILQAALDGRLIEPAQLLGHVTPDVLAHNLPPEVLSQLLASSLKAGAMTPERLLETIGPEVLCEHVPLDVLWSCISAGADRAGISGAEKIG